MTAGQLATFRRLKPVLAADMPQPSMALGDRAELCLLPLDRLVVDDRYQRSIGKQGRPNVLRILAGFDWRKFAPVVVTPVGDGLYAIIDGQHRATAALMHPSIDMVPCMVIKVTPEDAAAVFSAINGQVTRITPMQIWKARVVARDPVAVQVDAILRAADVKIIASKMPGQPYRKGETMAVGTLEGCFKKYGSDVLSTALQSITQSGNGNPGCLTAPMIVVMCEIIGSIDVWQRQPSKLFELMDELNLDRVLAQTASEAKLQRRPQAAILRELIANHLAAALRPHQVTGQGATAA